jgi:hypothetical protein
MTSSADQELPTASKEMRCKDCGETFEAFVAMLYCPKCRVRQHGAQPYYDGTESIWYRDKDQEKAKQDSHLWHEMVGDWRIKDEYGEEVWAADLAERYRNELRRRRTGDFRNRRSRFSSR